MVNKKKILILGGGFGGLYTYLSLRKEFKSCDIDVTIVNRTNYFLFTPMLHEVATGGLSHHQVVESIRQFIYKTDTKLVVSEIVSVNLEDKKVHTKDGDLPYDFLVISLGSSTNFFNTKGAEENSFILKDLSSAINIRKNFIEVFEKASLMENSEERKKELSFGIVGGGPTGVELVSETAELFLDTFSKYYKNAICKNDVSLYLINSGPELLAPFDSVLRKKALKILEKKGVKVLLNTRVKEVKEDSIVFSDDTALPVKHVVWTAGVKPNTPEFTSPVLLDKSGRIVVDEFLQMKDHKEVYALGDVASVLDKNGIPFPMLAQVALKEARIVGKNIKRDLSGKELIPFSYVSKGELVSLGRFQAVANIWGLKFTGVFAWFLWRTVYLFKFISNSKKFKIAMDWALNIFYPRDITKS